MKYKLGIYIGRFQPFHAGHLETVKIMLSKCEKVLISVGSHNRPQTIKNPWSSEERIQIIKEALVEEFNPDMEKGWRDFPERTILDRVKFQTVRDYMYNDNKWAAEVYSKAMLNGATHDYNTALFGHFKDDSSYYLNMFPQWELNAVENFYGIDATEVRRQMFEEKYVDPKLKIATSTFEGLAAWINTPSGDKLRDEYAFIQEYKAKFDVLPYPPTFVTVDTVVVKSGHILLVKRGFNPGKGLYALPGGFLNVGEKIERGALRELKEETKIDVPVAVLEKAIEDVHVFDHPRRSLRGRTITHAHLIDLGVGPLPRVKGSDDAVGAQWVPIADFHKMEHEMFEDHYDIIVHMTSRF